MCGIFGFALQEPISIARVFKVLEKLEVHKYPQEQTPLGGYGAGLAALLPDQSIFSEKVGRVSDSPVASLARVLSHRARSVSVLLAHVRMPSQEFVETAQFRETAQPYVVEFKPNLTVVSVHNGKLENYKEVRAQMGKRHVFESEKYELIDSEVIPHYFEETLMEKLDPDEALRTFSCSLQGPNTISMLQVDDENTLLHFVHTGRTRGLKIWANAKGEVIFCSRKEPLEEEFEGILEKGEFSEKLSIAPRENVGLQLTFPIDWEIKT